MIRASIKLNSKLSNILLLLMSGQTVDCHTTILTDITAYHAINDNLSKIIFQIHHSVHKSSELLHEQIMQWPIRCALQFNI